jgi:TonB family protein
MATAETPAQKAADEQPQRLRFEDIDVPQLWMAEPDESVRWRRRTLVTTSVILHILLILTCPWWLRILPTLRPVQVVAEQMQDRNLTYLDLPNDNSPLPKKTPETKFESDRDRIAQSKAPQLNREELNKILEAARPGAPGTLAPKAAAATPPSPPPAPAERSANPGGITAPPQQQTVAKLENLPPPGQSRGGGGPFAAGMSPSSTIEQAARAAAASRAGGPSVGSGGDYGLGTGQHAGIRSNVDVLSDTMGVDFGPYLSRVLHDVRENWYNIIPEVARPPLMKQGIVSIQFAITKDGQVAGLRLVSSSGDVALDRAAWGGITGSNPFPPLPPEFKGQYLALRFRFLYNPDKSQLQ